MMKRFIWLVIFLLSVSSIINAQKNQTFEIRSQNGNIILHVETGGKLQWSFEHKGQQVISPSAISLQLEGNEVLGDKPVIRSSKTKR